jgi:hypothetical protein
VRYQLALGCLLVAFAPLRAGDPDGKGVILERWESAYLNGIRSGHVHTRVIEHKDNGKVHLISSIEMRLLVRRGTDTISLGMDIGNVETPAGFVTGTILRQFLGKEQKVLVEGKVDGNKLRLTLDKTTALAPAPWNEKVLGIYGQQKLFKEKKIKAGDTLDYLSFEPSINLVIQMHVKAKELENVRFSDATRRYLRIEVVGDKVQTFQPPPLTIWLDDNHDIAASKTEIAGLGEIYLVRTNRDIALTPPGAGELSQVNQSIPLRQRVLRAHETTGVIYRIRIKGDTDPASTFARDGRQKVLSVDGDTIDLEVHRAPVAKVEKVGAEFLESSHFITSADEKVREHAKQAVADEADPWQKALKIERYVNQRMTAKPDQALATASHVAKTLEGDCTEYSMLAAAMCRAEGVPARTAIGLVYGEVRGNPIFAFHMWTEVWVAGEWRSIDATLGQGSIGAMHIKISDQSWKDEVTAAPLLPTLRVLGKLTIDVLRAEIAIDP